MITITHTIGRDSLSADVDVTDAELSAYRRWIEAALTAAFPDAEINVETVETSPTVATTVDVGDASVTVHHRVSGDVQQVLDAAWDDACATQVFCLGDEALERAIAGRFALA